MSDISAVILAGGLGTRLHPVVSDRPKPMALINNRPFLACLMDYWLFQGVRHFILSVGYKSDMIMQYFGEHYRGARIEYVIESTPLGTGGGLLLAAAKIREERRFLLLNGDSYFPINLRCLEEVAEKHDTDWCFSLFSTTDFERYLSIELATDGKINALKNHTQSVSCWANGGVYWIHPRALKKYQLEDCQPVSLEHEIFPDAMANNQCFYGVKFSDSFIDIGTPQDYQRAYKEIRHAYSSTAKKSEGLH